MILQGPYPTLRRVYLVILCVCVSSNLNLTLFRQDFYLLFSPPLSFLPTCLFLDPKGIYICNPWCIGVGTLYFILWKYIENYFSHMWVGDKNLVAKILRLYSLVDTYKFMYVSYLPSEAKDSILFWEIKMDIYPTS